MPETSFISLGQAKVSLFIALLQKDYSVDPACNYFAKIHGGDGNLPCGANRRCNLRCDDKVLYLSIR